MAETGILARGERVELIRGTIREMSPKGRPHVVAATKVLTALFQALEEWGSLYSEAPLGFEKLDSEPQPDVVICSSPRRRRIRNDGKSTPSGHRDRGIVTAIRPDGESGYADAQVPEYWVVSLVDRVLAIHREPKNGSYTVRLRLSPADRVSPEAWPDVTLEVSSLFPREP
jgi:Uma2 family endonuclease